MMMRKTWPPTAAAARDKSFGGPGSTFSTHSTIISLKKESFRKFTKVFVSCPPSHLLLRNVIRVRTSPKLTDTMTHNTLNWSPESTGPLPSSTKCDLVEARGP